MQSKYEIVMLPDPPVGSAVTPLGGTHGADHTQLRCAQLTNFLNEKFAEGWKLMEHQPPWVPKEAALVTWNSWHT